MIEVRQSATFRKWFGGLRDLKARVRIAQRIERAEAGNFGDVSAVGDGVSEMRVHYGPGYRLYFARQGSKIVILLCGGDKGSQHRDIQAARAMARELKP